MITAPISYVLWMCQVLHRLTSWNYDNYPWEMEIVRTVFR